MNCLPRPGIQGNGLGPVPDNDSSARKSVIVRGICRIAKYQEFSRKARHNISEWIMSQLPKTWMKYLKTGQVFIEPHAAIPGLVRLLKEREQGPSWIWKWFRRHVIYLAKRASLFLD